MRRCVGFEISTRRDIFDRPKPTRIRLRLVRNEILPTA